MRTVGNNASHSTSALLSGCSALLLPNSLSMQYQTLVKASYVSISLLFHFHPYEKLQEFRRYTARDDTPSTRHAIVCPVGSPKSMQRIRTLSSVRISIFDTLSSCSVSTPSSDTKPLRPNLLLPTVDPDARPESDTIRDISFSRVTFIIEGLGISSMTGAQIGVVAECSECKSPRAVLLLV